MSVLGVTGVRAVLPDRVLDDATIVIDGGVIVSVTERGAAPPGAIDGRGVLCLPGLVDTHSDGLEKELRPRPGVELDADFALRSYEGRVRAAGVTTMYHGIGFENGPKYERTVELADRLCDAIERRAMSHDAIVDHRILYRLDARDAAGFDALTHRLGRRSDDGSLPLVSFEDHTPGQGQYADRTALERYIMGTRGLTADEVRREVDAIVVERTAMAGNRARALPWLTERAEGGHIRLMAHDPADSDDVDQALSWHATIAEFPTTIDAARSARRRGMRTVCGAPNAMRGTSHSGNASAAGLIALGLCDGLASDYLPSSLLGAAAVLVHTGTCSLPQAVALVASGPAATVGLTDRGSIEVGRRGDLVLATFQGVLPTVRAVVRAADHGADGHEGTSTDITRHEEAAWSSRTFDPSPAPTR